MGYLRRLFCFTVLCFAGQYTYAQIDSTAAMAGTGNIDTVQKEKVPSLVQFSGVIVSGVDLNPVPFTNIAIKSTHRGTAADVYGYFSFVALEGDTILFSAVGFRRAEFVIPDDMDDARYSLIQMMQKDTILLTETVIYPWPTKEDFTEAFLALELPDDDLTKARKNLERERLKEMGETLAMDGRENYAFNMQQQQSQLYYAGQAPPNNLLNPLAWAKFVKAWKDGDFKKKDE